MLCIIILPMVFSQILVILMFGVNMKIKLI